MLKIIEEFDDETYSMKQLHIFLLFLSYNLTTILYRIYRKNISLSYIRNM